MSHEVPGKLSLRVGSAPAFEAAAIAAAKALESSSLLAPNRDIAMVWLIGNAGGWGDCALIGKANRAVSSKIMLMDLSSPLNSLATATAKQIGDASLFLELAGDSSTCDSFRIQGCFLTITSGGETTSISLQASRTR